MGKIPRKSRSNASGESNQPLIDSFEAAKPLFPEIELPLIEGEFEKYVWDEFDPRRAIEILLDGRDSYFAHKRALTAALGTWIICPRSRSTRRTAIAKAVMAKLADAEARSNEILHDVPRLFRDLFVRARFVGPHFFDEIYYPIGGIGSLASLRSTQSLKNVLINEAESLKYAIEVIRMHAVAVAGDGLIQITKDLPRGKLFGSGRAFVPFVAAKVYEQLREYAPEAQPPRVKLVAESADASSGDKKATGQLARYQLPADWASIKVGSLVLASEGRSDGWWEAIVVEEGNGDVLWLTWRQDNQRFTRHRRELALMHPEAKVGG